MRKYSYQFQSLFFLFAFATGGCGIFDTRPTEKPGENRSHFYTPTTDSLVIENFLSAIQERNTANYLKCFSDTTHGESGFVFIPSQDAYIQHAAVFTDWNITSEKNYFEKLRISTIENTPSALSFAEERRIESSDSVLFTAKYTLSFFHNKPFARTVRGYAEFLLARNSTKGTWSIQRWSDFKTTKDSSLTWSDWKALFNQ